MHEAQGLRVLCICRFVASLEQIFRLWASTGQRAFAVSHLPETISLALAHNYLNCPLLQEQFQLRASTIIIQAQMDRVRSEWSTISSPSGQSPTRYHTSQTTSKPPLTSSRKVRKHQSDTSMTQQQVCMLIKAKRFSTCNI